MNNNSKQNMEKKPQAKPNELGGFYFSSSIKIHDPNTKQVLVYKRGDT